MQGVGRHPQHEAHHGSKERWGFMEKAGWGVGESSWPENLGGVGRAGGGAFGSDLILKDELQLSLLHHMLFGCAEGG